MRLFVSGLISSFLIVPRVAFAFELDVGSDILDRIGDEPLMMDLAIGERAYVYDFSFCKTAGKLFAIGEAELELKDFENPSYVLVERLVGNRVSVTFQESATSEEDFLPFRFLKECQFEELAAGRSYTYFAVDTVQGLQSYSELLREFGITD